MTTISISGPEGRKPSTGRELAAALRKAKGGARLDPEDASVWLRELEEARGKIGIPVDKWRS
jgi:hypothetical protein